MKQSLFVPTLLLVAQASAQSTNLLGSLISEAISVFTSVTSELGQQTTSQSFLSATLTTPDPTALSSSFSLIATSSGTPSSTSQSSATITSSSASTAASSSFTQDTSSTSSTTQSGTGTGTGTSTAASGTSTAASGTSSAAGSVNHHDRNLAIILGTVLGALALGLLILLLLLCCRRRRRGATVGRRRSLSSRSSHEALTTQKGASSHVTPWAGNSLHEHSAAAGRDDHVGMPLMSERSNHEVPSAHHFHHGTTTPFVPTTMDSRQPSGTLPMQSGAHVGKEHRFRNGTGLDNHPHQGHHTGSALVAGAGGAALGAAAARHHSRSSERNYKPRLSGDPDVHPSYWDDAPSSQPLYPNSVDNSRRRSGSGPREIFHPRQNHRGSPLRDGASAAALGGVAGAATGAAAGGMGRRNHERGRSLASNPPPYNGPSNGYPSSTQGNVFNGSPARHSGVPPGATGMPQNRYYEERNPMVPAAAAGVLDNRRRSHSGGHPPVPSSIANGRRSIPSRSPKRTRFVDDSTGHDPMPYEHEKFGSDSPSRPVSGLSNHRNSAIRPTSGTDGIVSPISPQESNKRGSFGAPMSSNRVNTANVPGNPHSLPTPPSSTSPTPSPVPPRPNRQRTNSGLVSAVQDHFNPNATPSPTTPNPPPLPHSTAYTAPSNHNPTTTTTPLGAPTNGVSRKPVPQSSYNSVHPSTAPNIDSRRDSWWTGQEDSAWEKSYSGRNSAADNHHVGDGGVGGGIGEAR